MAGELHACGCYDGPFGPDDQTLVSIRCAGHVASVEPWPGHTLLTREAVAYALARAEKIAGKVAARPKMATSIKKEETRMNEHIGKADPECIGGLLAALRVQDPDWSLHVLADQIDWESVRYYGEPISEYRKRDEMLRRERLGEPAILTAREGRR